MKAFTIKLSQEQYDQLGEIAIKNYRTPSKSHCIRLLIEDMYRKMTEGEKEGDKVCS